MSTTPRWDPEYFAELQRQLDPMLERAKARAEERTPEEDDALEAEMMAEPVDPEIALIVDFLMLELTAEQMVEVEDRLATDEAFRKKAAPIIWMYDSPVSFTPPSERVALVYDGPLPGDDPETTRAAELARRVSGQNRLILLVVAVLLGLGWWGFSRMQASTARAELDAIEARHGRASTKHLWTPVAYVTAAGEEQTVDVSPGVTVRVRPTSRLTVPRDVGTGVPNLVLDGAAVIEIDERAPVVSLHTPAAIVQLSPGRYAVSSPPRSTELRITVDSGLVRTRAGVQHSDRYLVVSGAGAGQATASSTGAGFPAYTRIVR